MQIYIEVLCIYALVNKDIIDNGLSPDQHQAIIWTNADVNRRNEILIEIHYH